MSIIYSYPEQGILNAGDMLIGTSVEKVGGKQKNVTKNFTVQQIADFINRGAGFVDPVATDFQIPVFNQLGKKITGSIMSQDSSPSNGVAGTGITIAGTLTTTGSVSTAGGFSAPGIVNLGSGNNLISLLSKTVLGGPIVDTNGITGNVGQILISGGTGTVSWINYAAGLTYKGVWNASTNTPTLVSGTGTNGDFYIVSVSGSTDLNGITDWKVGDWAVFVESGATDTWQKIDNSSELTGSGTANTLAMFTANKVLGDSLISQAGVVVSVAGSLNTAGPVTTPGAVNGYDITTTTGTNTNFRIKGNGTGGLEVRGNTASATDGKIQLNCYVNTHGVTIQSPPHSDSATYTLILPSSVGTVNQVLTSAGAGAGAQLTWSTPTTGTVTSINYTTDFAAFTAGPGAAITTAGTFTLNKNGGTAGQYIDGAAGAWTDLPSGDTYDLGSGASGVSNSIELKLTSGSGTDNSAVTLTGGTGITVAQAGDVVTLTGSAQGVTSLATGSSDTITLTGTGAGPFTGAVTATANTAAGVALGNANLATGGQIQSAINTALSGALIFRGTFNAATGAIDGGSNFLYQVNGAGAFDPSLARVAVAVGDFYIANVAGNFYGTGGTVLGIGDEAIAITAAAVTNSVLTDWNVVPAQSSGGTVTGTGAATQVTFWDAASNINGDTAFNWDNINKRLGIGTASPSHELDIASTSSSLFKTTASGTTNSNQHLQFNNNFKGWENTVYGSAYPVGDVSFLGIGANGAAQSANTTAAIGTNGAFPLLLGTSGATRLTITSAGKVGIGTTTPQVSLDLSANTDAILVPNGSTAARPSGILPGMIRYNTTTSEFEGYSGILNVSGSWGALGGASLPTKTVVNLTGTGQNSIALGVTPSSTAYVDLYVDGVYQNKNTYAVSGVNLTLTSPAIFPTGVSIEAVTTT